MKMTRSKFLLALTALPLTYRGLLASTMEKKLDLSVLKPSTSVQLDRSRFLACIAQVETGNDDTKIGPCGSRSRYQIHRNTWYQYTTQNFVLECWGRTALEVAQAHLTWLIKHLDRPTPYRLALAWHRGLNWVQAQEAVLYSSGFAYRVHNLYHDSDFLTAAFLNNNNDEFATAYRSNRPQSFPTNSTG